MNERNKSMEKILEYIGGRIDEISNDEPSYENSIRLEELTSMLKPITLIMSEYSRLRSLESRTNIFLDMLEKRLEELDKEDEEYDKKLSDIKFVSKYILGVEKWLKK